MLNDTLELNIAAKLYNKCQTDVNNHSNKCSGPNLMDRIISSVQMKSWAGKALETVNCCAFLKCRLTVIIQ
jgi:hypothetical protein